MLCLVGQHNWQFTGKQEIEASQVASSLPTIRTSRWKYNASKLSLDYSG